MGHIDYNMNVPFLPQPQSFLFQVEAEMRYQKQLLINSSIAALDKIDEKCPFPDPAQRTQLLGVLIEKITIYQENVRRDINKSCSVWHNFPLYKTETCATLEKLDTVGESARRRVQNIRDIWTYLKTIIEGSGPILNSWRISSMIARRLGSHIMVNLPRRGLWNPLLKKLRS